MKNQLIVFVIMTMIAGNVPAAAQRGQDDGSARIQQMMRQLALERDRLKKENAVMTNDLAELKKKQEKLESKYKKTQARLSRTEKSNDQYKDRLELYTNKIQELVGRLKNTLVTLRKAKTTINDQSGELLSCMNYNIKLFDAGSDMLSKYEEKGVWDAIAQSEPLTQLKQVEIENVIEEYRHRMLDLQVLSKAEDVQSTNVAADKVITGATNSGEKTLLKNEEFQLKKIENKDSSPENLISQQGLAESADKHEEKTVLPVSRVGDSDAAIETKADIAK